MQMGLALICIFLVFRYDLNCLKRLRLIGFAMGRHWGRMNDAEKPSSESVRVGQKFDKP
jgi:hypothetical protein